MESPWCDHCGYSFVSKAVDPEGALCGACRRGFYRFDLARAYGPFQEPLKEIIHQLKYQSHPSLARPLAARMAAVYEVQRDRLDSDCVVPVPLHSLRQRQRGFNQALEISRHFCAQTGVNLEPRWLLRTRATQVQAGLSRRARRLNVHGAFEVRRAAKVRGCSLLLIDDVFTTGATLNECAKILKENGVRKVTVLTVARVIRE